MQSEKTIEHLQLPNYFNKDGMKELYGEGWLAMAKCIGYRGLIFGLIGAIFSVS